VKKKIIIRVTMLALSAMLSVGGIIALTSCKSGGGSTNNANEYSVILNEDFMEIDLFGDGVQLQATTKKDRIETEGTVIWESLNSEIVTVDQQGNIKPVSVGEGKITASWEGVKAECTVVVKSDSIPVVKADQTSLGFIYGVSPAYPLDTWVLYKGVEYRKDVDFSYSIPDSGKTVATVDKNGIVTPVGLGETELTVKAIYKNYDKVGMTIKIPVRVSYDVEVNLAFAENSPEELFVKQVEYEGVVYQNQTSFIYQVNKMESDGMAEVADATVSWKTSDETVLSVTDGIVTALSDGTASVWCEYVYEGYACASNKLEITVKPYAVVKALDEKVLLDKSDPSKIPTPTEIFGVEFDGEITTIAIGDNNLLREGKIEAGEYEDGYYAVAIANDEGYAFQVNGAVVSVSVEEEGVLFGLMQGEKSQNERYYNWILPAQSEIETLMNKGYRALKIGYRYTAPTEESVTITAKYESELKHTATANINQVFSFDLNILLDRYSEFDEYSRSEYAFKVSEEFGKLTLNSCYVTNISADASADFKIDRGFEVKGSTVVNNVEKENIKAPVSATITAKTDNRIIVTSSKGISKASIGYLLNDGYNAYTVKYYLEYDATKMTKQLFAYAAENVNSTNPRPIIGQKQSIVANRWAEITLPLDAYYVTRNLFDLEVSTADDGGQMEYTLYVASVKAAKVAGMDQPIRMYSGYPVEMWTSKISPRGVNEYDKQIEDKTAYFYTTVDVQSTWQYGCPIRFFTGLNINVAKLQQLKEEGYTTLDFDVYAKTSDGSTIDLRTNPEKKDWGGERRLKTLVSGEWQTVSMDIDYLIEYYSILNGCGGTNCFWVIIPNYLSSGQNIVYEIGVGAIAPGGKA